MSKHRVITVNTSNDFKFKPHIYFYRSIWMIDYRTDRTDFSGKEIINVVDVYEMVRAMNLKIVNNWK